MSADVAPIKQCAREQGQGRQVQSQAATEAVAKRSRRKPSTKGGSKAPLDGLASEQQAQTCKPPRKRKRQGTTAPIADDEVRGTTIL